MHSVLLLDLGETLADGERPLPHAVEAVRALNQFEAADGSRLSVSLVSDFDAEPGATNGVAAAFDDYLAVLGRLGLRPLFEPVEHRVTLSAHAGASKPDPRVFRTALERLGVSAGLASCVFVTENAAHVTAARRLGMAALRYGPVAGVGIDIAGWAEGPLRIARIVAPESDRDLTLALDVALRATRHIGVSRARRTDAEGTVAFDASLRVALDDPSLGDLSGVEVEVPGRGTARLSHDGRVVTVDAEEPSPDVVRESTAMVRLLRARGSVAGAGTLPRSDATHEVVTEEGGARILVRRRYDTG